MTQWLLLLRHHQKWIEITKSKIWKFLIFQATITQNKIESVVGKKSNNASTDRGVGAKKIVKKGQGLPLSRIPQLLKPTHLFNIFLDSQNSFDKILLRFPWFHFKNFLKQ